MAGTARTVGSACSPLALTGGVLVMKVTRDGSLWLGTNDGLLRYGP